MEGLRRVRVRDCSFQSDDLNHSLSECSPSNKNAALVIDHNLLMQRPTSPVPAFFLRLHHVFWILEISVWAPSDQFHLASTQAPLRHPVLEGAVLSVQYGNGDEFGRMGRLLKEPKI